MRGLRELLLSGDLSGRLADQLALIRSDERGATLALVALLLTAMLGMTAMVVDLGSMRVVRRGLVPAADAGALAAAQDLALQPWNQSGACATAGSYVVANAPAAVMGDCLVDTWADGGVVTVGVSEALGASFVSPPSGAFEPAEASSAAAWGRPLAVSDLRPIGLCYDGFAPLQQLIDNPPTSVVYIEVPFARDDPLDCGGVDDIGNFASLDFESGTDFDTIRDWIRDGYPDAVELDGPTSSGCGPGVPCLDRPYAAPAVADAMWALVASGRYVGFPVYDYADADSVHVFGVIRARLYGFDLSGPLAGWKLKLKVKPGLLAGTCCGGPGLAAGSRVVAICGVEGWIAPACQNGGGP